jgi:hypothetical protein
MYIQPIMGRHFEDIQSEDGNIPASFLEGIILRSQKFSFDPDTIVASHVID